MLRRLRSGEAAPDAPAASTDHMRLAWPRPVLRLSVTSHGRGHSLHWPLLATRGQAGLELSWASADGATPGTHEADHARRFRHWGPIPLSLSHDLVLVLMKILLLIVIVFLVLILLGHPGPLGLVSAAGDGAQFGNILDQAPNLELLSHGEEPGDVRSGDRHLAIIHEVNDAGNIIQVDILGHHYHWVSSVGA